MSNNIVPFFTTINAKPGVRVTQSLDENFVGVVDVSIDSDYIINLVRGAATFSALTTEQQQSLSKIADIFEAMGLDQTGNVPIIAPVIDSEIPTITYEQDTFILTENLIVRMSIITNNGDRAIDRTITIGRGTLKQNVIRTLQRVLLKDNLAVKYINKLYVNSEDEMSVGWKPTYEKFTFRFEIKAAAPEDGSQFSFIQKK